MILNLEKQPREALAVIDAAGNQLTYGELCDFSNEMESAMPFRSLLFLLTENNVGGIAWSIGCIGAKQVPLILNAHTEEGLFQNLMEIYCPPYLCVPKENPVVDQYKVLMEAYDYVLLSTGNEPCSLHKDLSHLLPTSGSTGSPKLVRHMYSNIEAAALNISTFFDLTNNDRPLLVLPLYYTMGLSIVFSHLYVGATVLVTNQSMTDRAF